jgi:hypothetical protein
VRQRTTLSRAPTSVTAVRDSLCNVSVTLAALEVAERREYRAEDHLQEERGVLCYNVTCWLLLLDSRIRARTTGLPLGWIREAFAWRVQGPRCRGWDLNRAPPEWESQPQTGLWGTKLSTSDAGRRVATASVPQNALFSQLMHASKIHGKRLRERGMTRWNPDCLGLRVRHCSVAIPCGAPSHLACNCDGWQSNGRQRRVALRGWYRCKEICCVIYLHT